VLFNQVQETALRDGLTGLLTHRAFQGHLDAAILEASRYGQPLSVILSDVDHFKSR
jgi:diguanylate cyclase (GGDEF)-like protein